MKAWTHTSTSTKVAALGGLAYTFAWIAALAGALAAWTQFHAILRHLGPDAMLLFGTVAVTRVTVFAITAGVLKRVIAFTLAYFSTSGGLGPFTASPFGCWS